MASHKLTLLGHPASRKIQLYLQHGDLHGSERRLAYGDGVVAISGWAGIELARDLYRLDLQGEGLLQRFYGMVRGFGFVDREASRTADVCAEAHLWMTLAALHDRNLGQRHAPRHLHPHPRHLDIWVYQIDRKNRPKEDSPCHNGRQWVRREFQTVNGTS